MALSPRSRRAAEELEHHSAPGDCLQFHHVQMFVHKLQPLAAYKKLEDLMNQLAQQQERLGTFFLDAGSKAKLSAYWKNLAPDLPDPTAGARARALCGRGVAVACMRAGLR
jgi:hypothetical protein